MIPTCGTPHVGSLIQCMERLKEGEIARVDYLLEVEDSLIYFPTLICPSVPQKYVSRLTLNFPSSFSFRDSKSNTLTMS